jgi:hypothetical protein
VSWRELSRIQIFGGLSLATRQQFDPAKIPPYTVLRFSYKWGEGRSGPKRFVCLMHRDGMAICLKATSKVESYKNNPKKMIGAVFYAAGSLPCFDKDTVIEPDNYIAVLHSTLAKQHATRELKILGVMPDDFVDVLIKATLASETMTPRQQRALIGILTGSPV